MHTPEQIGTWARASGLTNAVNGDGQRVWSSEQDTSAATRFAALVAQHERERQQAEVARYACFVYQAITTLGFQPIRGKDVALMVSLMKAMDAPQADIEAACGALKAAIKDGAAAIRNSDGG